MDAKSTEKLAKEIVDTIIPQGYSPYQFLHDMKEEKVDDLKMETIKAIVLAPESSTVITDDILKSLDFIDEKIKELNKYKELLGLGNNKIFTQIGHNMDLLTMTGEGLEYDARSNHYSLNFQVNATLDLLESYKIILGNITVQLDK